MLLDWITEWHHMLVNLELGRILHLRVGDTIVLGRILTILATTMLEGIDMRVLLAALPAAICVFGCFNSSQRSLHTEYGENYQWHEEYYDTLFSQMFVGSFDHFHDTLEIPSEGFFVFSPAERSFHLLVYLSPGSDSGKIWLWFPIMGKENSYSKCKSALVLKNDETPIFKRSIEVSRSMRRVTTTGKVKMTEQSPAIYFFKKKNGIVESSGNFQNIYDKNGAIEFDASNVSQALREYVQLQQLIYRAIPVDSVASECGALN